MPQPSKDQSAPASQIDWDMLIQNAIFGLALSLIVLTRRDPGYRLVRVGTLLTFFGVMLLMGSFFMTPDPIIVAAIVFFRGCYVRYVNWRAFCRGSHFHTRYIGTSFFDGRFTPAFLRTNRRAARYLEPLIWIVTGWFMIPLFPVSGGWLTTAGVALRLFEQSVFNVELNRHLDMMDNHASIEIQSRLSDACFDARKGKSKSASSASGIATGLGDDIAANIKNQHAARIPPKLPK